MAVGETSNVSPAYRSLDQVVAAPSPPSTRMRSKRRWDDLEVDDAVVAEVDLEPAVAARSAIVSSSPVPVITSVRFSIRARPAVAAETNSRSP